jgi:ribulose-5-phosphate 4-epimerase/fuculose-1-phosphate aldolase
MSISSEEADIHRRFSVIGSALLRLNLNNTHSGNMSWRDPHDSDRFWITASGSRCGELSPGDLVAVRFDDLHYEGPARPSTETNTHRGVLQIPGVKACIHCHSIASTLLGFETPQKPVFLIARGSPPPHPGDSIFQPVDVWGASLIGAVTAGLYQNPVGSSEMEQRITADLRRAPLTLVKGHGPFARGESLEECLHYLSILENSAAVAIALRRRAIDILEIQHAVRSRGPQAIFAWSPRRLGRPHQAAEPSVEAANRAEFRCWLSYNFDLGLGAFGTGSMSRKLSADEMLFCPMSAAPQGIEVPLQRIPLRPQGPEAADVRLHRLIYSRTPFVACMLAASPLATAEAMTALAATDGMQVLTGGPAPPEPTAGRRPVVAPIDAEAAYGKVRLPVAGIQALDVDAGEDLIPGLLRTGNGCCLIAGCGVIAGGEKSLEQAAYRVSLAERLARFRMEVDLHHRLFGGPAVAEFE